MFEHHYHASYLIFFVPLGYAAPVCSACHCGEDVLFSEKHKKKEKNFFFPAFLHVHISIINCANSVTLEFPSGYLSLKLAN